MLYALRKLIAFVFLAGIFWFIYSDPAEIGSPWFMHTLGVITFLFAFFWMVIPFVVVRMRIRNRERQNVSRYAEWRKGLDGQELQPLAYKTNKFVLAEGEIAWLHEKGTLYVVPRTGFNEISVKGLPGDVAFPGLRRNSRKIQRTHCYFTDRRIMFAGKALSYSLSYSELRKFVDKPGGIVFVVEKAEKKYTLAFTFQNPLIAVDYLKHLCARTPVN